MQNGFSINFGTLSTFHGYTGSHFMNTITVLTVGLLRLVAVHQWDKQRRRGGDGARVLRHWGDNHPRSHRQSMLLLINHRRSMLLHSVQRQSMLLSSIYINRCSPAQYSVHFSVYRRKVFIFVYRISKSKKEDILDVGMQGSFIVFWITITVSLLE